jgi:hypothetical protein
MVPSSMTTHIVFQSVNVPSIATLNLRLLTQEDRRRLETTSDALDTPRNMTAVYARLLNLPVIYSVKLSSHNVVTRPGKKAKSSSGMWMA